ncbi:MAG: Verru_Chthon cassette protein D [Verrucomicrobiota bacterium]
MRAERTPDPSGFSLVELLVVIAIIAILLAVGASALSQSGNSLNLTTTVASVQGILDEARQTAVSKNKYVQVRFLGIPGADRYKAISLYVGDSPYYGTSAEYDTWVSQGLLRQQGRTSFLPQTITIPKGSQTSKLLADLAADTDFTRTGTNKVAGQSYEWVAFYFRPNGITDYQMLKGTPYSGTNAFFSLVVENEFAQTAPNLPKNFATLTLSPASGRPVVFRP